MKLVTPNEDNRISNETLQRIAQRLQPQRYPDGSIRGGGSLAPHLTSTTTGTVRPVNFTMWVQPPNLHRSISSSVHIYTALSDGPANNALPLEHLRNWRESFPCLASLHHAGAVDCEIVLMEASINMTAPAASFKGWELGTAFEVLASSSFAGHAWHYSTTIYDTGESVETQTATLPQVGAGYEDGTVKLQPSLLPRFWAPRFVVWDKERHHLETRGDGHGAEERTRTRVRRMSAVQELYATPPASGAVPKRVAMLLWKFSKTRAGDVEGKTTWRNLIPPPSRILTNSPAPPAGGAAPMQEALWGADQHHGQQHDHHQDDSHQHDQHDAHAHAAPHQQLSLFEEAAFDASQAFPPLDPSPTGTLPASPSPASYYPSFSSASTGALHHQHHNGQHDGLLQSTVAGDDGLGEGLYPGRTSLLDAFEPAVGHDSYLPPPPHAPSSAEPHHVQHHHHSSQSAQQQQHYVPSTSTPSRAHHEQHHHQHHQQPQQPHHLNQLPSWDPYAPHGMVNTLAPYQHAFGFAGEDALGGGGGGNVSGAGAIAESRDATGRGGHGSALSSHGHSHGLIHGGHSHAHENAHGHGHGHGHGSGMASQALSFQ